MTNEINSNALTVLTILYLKSNKLMLNNVDCRDMYRDISITDFTNAIVYLIDNNYVNIDDIENDKICGCITTQGADLIKSKYKTLDEYKIKLDNEIESQETNNDMLERNNAYMRQLNN